MIVWDLCNVRFVSRVERILLGKIHIICEQASAACEQLVDRASRYDFNLYQNGM